MCPSDPWQPMVISQNTPNAYFVENVYAIPAGSTFYQQFTSYGANQGTYPGTFQQSYGQAQFAQYNGVIYNDSHVKLSAITDGTSNTFLFGERARSLFAQNDIVYENSDGSWNSQHWFDTMVTTYFPPKVSQRNLSITLGPPPSSGNGTAVPTDAESRHPGGVNFCLLRWLGSIHQEFHQFVAIPAGPAAVGRLQRCILAGAGDLRELHLLRRAGNAVWRLPGSFHPGWRRSHQRRSILIDSGLTSSCRLVHSPRPDGAGKSLRFILAPSRRWNIRANLSCQRTFLRSYLPQQVLLLVAAVPSQVPW
jgi:Protein of unknown function (DUF1559)